MKYLKSYEISENSNYIEIYLQDILKTLPYTYPEIEKKLIKKLKELFINKFISYTCGIKNCCKKPRRGFVTEITIDTDLLPHYAKYDINNFSIYFTLENDTDDDYLTHDTDTSMPIKIWTLQTAKRKYNL